jgi:hypothetical protein
MNGHGIDNHHHHQHQHQQQQQQGGKGGGGEGGHQGEKRRGRQRRWAVQRSVPPSLLAQARAAEQPVSLSLWYLTGAAVGSDWHIGYGRPVLEDERGADEVRGTRHPLFAVSGSFDQINDTEGPSVAATVSPCGVHVSWAPVKAPAHMLPGNADAIIEALASAGGTCHVDDIERFLQDVRRFAARCGHALLTRRLR